MDKENLELAEEHIKLAAELIEKGGLNSEGNENDKFKKAAFELEKAEANLEDISEE
ncbi:hypothetical protein KAS08_02705 [Candidatus Pacearchaeota archaeon]|nr:hypothetical protein [Candidatus Pacearchaeota archaeon]